MLQLMAVGAATVTHSGSDDEEVRHKPLGPEVMALSLSEASVEASVRGAPLQSEPSMEGEGAAQS